MKDKVRFHVAVILIGHRDRFDINGCSMMKGDDEKSMHVVTNGADGKTGECRR